MNALVRHYLYEDANFDEVIVLSENPSKTWEEITQLFPSFPKGWFALSRIPTEDRIEFTKSFWLQRLPFSPKVHQAISHFFNALDDVGVVLVKTKQSWQPQLIYSLYDNSCFFRGLMPAQSHVIDEVREELDLSLPTDWISFAKIHNGFGKLSDMNLIAAEEIPDARRKLMDFLIRHPVKSGDVFIDPGSLIPFFEVAGLSSFQCFYTDWYPEGEMGNVYFSGIDYTMSDIQNRGSWNENGAFATFLEWLVCYLEGMEMVH